MDDTHTLVLSKLFEKFGEQTSHTTRYMYKWPLKCMVNPGRENYRSADGLPLSPVIIQRIPPTRDQVT